MRSMCAAILAALLILVAGCGEEEDEAKTLSSKHPGWTQPNCNTSGCHKASGHTDQATRRCGTCHGGNGACTPPADHLRDQDCVSCHQSHHTFTESSVCPTCHFAGAGTRQCTTPSPDMGGPG
jgi:hypothetical protein